MQISGPYLQHYPGILAELERLNIAMESLRYVEVKQKERIPREWTPVVKIRKEIQAIAVLHTGENIPLTLTELIYNDTPLQG
jgi:hypothetical protein